MVKEKKQIPCVYCGADMVRLTLNADYMYVGWASSNISSDMPKITKPAHIKCVALFIELNWREIKKLLMRLAQNE